jgi:predicted lysophospholipase L1 biosynthesis ABC-type transport system permease subunit
MHDFPGTVNTARPTADIRTLQRVQSIPYLLATMVGIAGLVAVAIVLAQLARRARRELALLRCVGLTGRQLVGVVLWQATACATVALLIGLPLGVVVGRSLWHVAADRMGTGVPPTVPVGGLLVATGGLLLVANAMALLPALRARQAHPAAALRSD